MDLLEEQISLLERLWDLLLLPTCSVMVTLFLLQHEGLHSLVVVVETEVLAIPATQTQITLPVVHRLLPRLPQHHHQRPTTLQEESIRVED